MLSWIVTLLALGSELLKTKISFKKSTIFFGVIMSARLLYFSMLNLENMFRGILFPKSMMNLFKFL